MKRRFVWTVLTCGGIGVLSLLAAGSASGTRELSLAELQDRIAGGWAGQMIGVSYGAPTEFRFNDSIIPEDKLPTWTPDKVSNSLQQDDLYVDMTFAQVLDAQGLEASTSAFGAMFKDSKYNLWHANLAARRALRRGITAEQSGLPRYNVHANDIDFQIEADFIGLMAPGLPQSANIIAERAGKVMNYGDGIYGGEFISGMYAAAFFEKDPRRIVEAGLAAIPAQSPYGQVIRDTLEWSRQNPNDWTRVWGMLQQKWNKREPCPEGALIPFNIDAKLNGAYVAMGVLYGKGDLGKTITIATRCGQDSDCNPSSAAGIVGVMLGYKALPEEWKGGIPALADKKFAYTNYSFNEICKSTEKRALALIAKTGGRVSGDKVTVKVQSPRPSAPVVWDDYGSPVERIAVTDTRWLWKGKWETVRNEKNDKVASKLTTEKGAEVSIRFKGTGVVLVGPYLPTGGRADVYLDGKLARSVDIFEENRKSNESVWHTFGLVNQDHELKLVAKGEPYQGSKGSDMAVSSLIVFQ
jgi:hypothetical protein